MNVSILCIILSLLTVSSVSGQLNATTVGARFPFGLSYATATFDGQDAVYIIGGTNTIHSWQDTIYKYHIFSDLIEELPVKLPFGLIDSSAIIDEEGNTFTFSGWATNAIFKFDPSALSVNEIGTFPLIHISGNGAVQIGPQTALVFHKETVYEINLTTGIIFNREENITNFGTPIFASKVGEEIFLFGAKERSYTVYNLATNTSQEIQDPEAPNFDRYSFPATVFDGSSLWLIGGLTPEPGTNGIYQFDPRSRKFTFWEVSGYPATSTKKFYNTMAVYKDKRIWVFGGRTTDTISFITGDRNSIFYIDLSVLDD